MNYVILHIINNVFIIVRYNLLQNMAYVKLILCKWHMFKITIYRYNGKWSLYEKN